MANVTIKDVARVAQVSVATVSRALNGHGNVAEEVRERVFAAAKDLRYTPHAAAHSLSSRRTQTLGVVLPDLHGEFFSECVRGMDKEASRRGYLLLLSNMHDDGDQAAVALRAMRGRVDGLLVMAPHIDPETLERAIPPALPSVMINSHADLPGRPALRFDNRHGAEAMIDHLYALDQTVRGNGRDRQTGSQVTDALMVQAVDAGFGAAQRGGQLAARLDADQMGLIIARERAEEVVLDRPRHPFHHVLIERTAQGHVEHLMAAADRQQRLVFGHRLAGQE